MWYPGICWWWRQWYPFRLCYRWKKKRCLCRLRRGMHRWRTPWKADRAVRPHRLPVSEWWKGRMSGWIRRILFWYWTSSPGCGWRVVTRWSWYWNKYTAQGILWRNRRWKRYPALLRWWCHWATEILSNLYHKELIRGRSLNNLLFPESGFA